MNLKKLISLLLCLILTVSCVLPLVSCKKEKEDEGGKGNQPGGTVIGGGNGGTTTGDTEHTIRVVTVGGMPLEGVMVYVYDGDNICAMPTETDENGEAKFTLANSGDYSVQLDGAPDGYNVRAGETKEDRYPLTPPDTVITLSSAPIKEGGFKSSYELGDVMYDFTLTDVNGKQHTLSEMLKTKDMVMLNFWYVGCSNCYYEFPYINTVYDAYKDDIEILAINDYATDTVEDVKAYPEYLGEDLKMPLFKVDPETLSIASFSSGGWPTTVIIDRYGVVCMIEIGAVLGESKWKNIFDRFVGEDYKQALITDPSILNPMIEPTIKWEDDSEEKIANAFNSGDITVSYHPETSEKDAKYSWPFIVDEFMGESVVRPSNNGIDNSYSILYAEVQLKPGQAIMFDYFSSTQKNDTGADVLYILVDGKDIYSIAGVSEEFETCCTYVDPRPVTDSNKDDIATYEVAFAFYKDTVDYSGDDTVYLKNLRVESVENIPVETYIFRFAATDINETGDGYNTYVEVFYNENDGYYHVGSVNGPLLLANHLSYTQFDSEKTISERVYANYELMVNGVNKFNEWVIYGNAAINSQMSYYTPVTEELREMLIAYCDAHRTEVGKAANDNLWLQLCVYYDAYGKDADGNPTKHLPDPIEGLTSFSAFDVEIKNDNPTVAGDIVASAEVTYNKVIMPRGYLYKFVPTKSGAYRINSKSDKEVNGWIFINSENWAATVNEGIRDTLTSDEVAERYTPDLIIDSNGDGKYENDNKNVSLVAYMEAGKEYYIDIAYYDLYEVGTFTFDVKWIGETFGYFIQASPGPITYVESLDGSMGKLVAVGIDVIFVEENGVEYAYQLIGYDNNGYPIIGEKIYADFFYPTTLFQSQSIEKLITAHAFNYNVTEKDREALILLDEVKLNGKKALTAKWIAEQIVADEDAANAKWDLLDINGAVKDYYDGDFDNTYSNDVKAYAEYVYNEGVLSLKKEWGIEHVTSYVWDLYEMDKVIRGEFSADAETKAKQEETLASVEASFTDGWNYYQMDDIRNGIFHNHDNRTDKDRKAEEYLAHLAEFGKDSLKERFDAEFSSINPPQDSGITDISEWRYNYLWNYYQMDDVQAGIFHGTVKDYTADMLKYVEKMENDMANPERQGCVAVTRELAMILDALIAREVFEDVENGWLKFCYYYKLLGVEDK